ncbi:methyl-accepting chemotaxis protein signaling domain protein [Bacteriovorax sp. BAL6_X]|uniref:methyl-accepting chemotaxis protein n=1 Tax=Bacteriovorax sp. BAL6_X TaxID=1201290 RepID=UPI0003858F3F|nr:methyl-accepting chemotaxis protein [Bacteriovorax sp. BAL6_X]EPZ49240.1 methyl-accepting chemotaxis protein signaling domain protein [Bacteriovorax sp. BAL6_X]
MKKTSMSMNKKTILSFIGIFTMFGIGLTISIYSYYGLVKNLKHTVQNDLRMKDSMRTLAANLAEQISNEKQYMISQNPEDVKRFIELEKINDEVFEGIKSLEVEYSNEINWDELTKYYDQYSKNFDLTRNVLKIEGDSKEGLRGELRRYAHDIESKIKKYDLNPSFKVSLLTLRRHEKDFLLRRSKKYSDKAIVEGEKLKKELIARKYRQYIYNDVSKSVDNYVKTFVKLYENQLTLEKHMAIAFEESNKIINLIQKDISLIDKKTSEKIEASNALEEKISFYIPILFAIIAAFAYGFQYNFAKSIKKIIGLSERLRDSSHVTEKSSTNMSMASSKVSSSVTQQASAIQETVATLNEITAMVNKSVENAKISSQKADESQRVALEGKNAVNDMVEAIGQINGNNEDIMKEMNRNNEEIVKIVDVINEISEKTKVINDIVFQTKLLSFNASVEAARAGEHGKGFAVVAEEVGNLAQMSGNAALEIEELLGGSIKKVQSIVDETQVNVKKLISEAQISITKGVDVSENCGKILDSVVDNVDAVTKMMTEISTAAEEQAEGINNISDAMNELDEVTHTNSTIAQETSGFAESLSEQTSILNGIVEELESEVLGKVQEFTMDRNTLVESVSSAPVKSDTVIEKEVVEEFPVFEKPLVTEVVKQEATKIAPEAEEMGFDDPVLEVDSDEYPSENDARFDKAV